MDVPLAQLRVVNANVHHTDQKEKPPRAKAMFISLKIEDTRGFFLIHRDGIFHDYAKLEQLLRMKFDHQDHGNSVQSCQDSQKILQKKPKDTPKFPLRQNVPRTIVHRSRKTPSVDRGIVKTNDKEKHVKQM
jgi:hypothetical protein